MNLVKTKNAVKGILFMLKISRESLGKNIGRKGKPSKERIPKEVITPSDLKSP